MYIYDEAHKLAKMLHDSQEYADYKLTREKAYADEPTKVMLADYKKLQFEAQAAYLSGQEPEAETMEKLKKVSEILGMSPDVTAYLSAEYRLNKLLSDVYKILADAVELAPDFLSE